MMFFHPFVRRAFFDTGDSNAEHEALNPPLRDPSARGYSTCTTRQRTAVASSARVEVTDLRLLMFANGVGILTIGVEANNISYAHALWINEMMRKIYPSSSHQIQTGRIPNRLALVLESGADRRTVAEERWQSGRGLGYRPQLSNIVLSLLHFANYAHQEYEATLDERMIVNSFVSLDRITLPPGFESSEEYEMAFSRLLYVDREGEGFRYDAQFAHQEMRRHVYRRWQRQGTLYGMTAYSSVTSTLAGPGTGDPPDVVHRMFRSKHLLMAVIALFYRASLLGFAEESALVSRQLFPVFSGGTVRASAYSVCHPPDGGLPLLQYLLVSPRADDQG